MLLSANFKTVFVKDIWPSKLPDSQNYSNQTLYMNLKCLKRIKRFLNN